MQPTLDQFTDEARRWLDEHASKRRDTGDGELVWGEGDFSVAVFHALSFEEEDALLARAKAWTQLKATKGYHLVAGPQRFGGLGLPREYGRAYNRVEAQYDTPDGHETHSVTTRL